MQTGMDRAVGAMVVAMLLGGVDVRYDGKTYELSAGMTQAFGEEHGPGKGYRREGERKWAEKKDGEEKAAEKKREGADATVTSVKPGSHEAAGTVVRGGETLVLQTGTGEEMTFLVKTVEKKGEKKRDPLADIALRKTLRKGMKTGSQVSVTYELEEHLRINKIAGALAAEW